MIAVTNQITCNLVWLFYGASSETCFVLGDAGNARMFTADAPCMVAAAAIFINGSLLLKSDGEAICQFRLYKFSFASKKISRKPNKYRKPGACMRLQKSPGHFLNQELFDSRSLNMQRVQCYPSAVSSSWQRSLNCFVNCIIPFGIK